MKVDQVIKQIESDGIITQRELELIIIKRKIQDLSMKIFDELGTIQYDNSYDHFRFGRDKMKILMKLIGELIVISNSEEAK